MNKTFIYNFFELPGEGISKPFLPIRIINSHNEESSIIWYALVDTGAESCLFTKEICNIVNHNFDAQDVIIKECQGISDTPLKTFTHSFKIELLDSNSEEVIWTSNVLKIDCGDYSDFPLLLGASDFLSNFVITIDYPKETIMITIPQK